MFLTNTSNIIKKLSCNVQEEYNHGYQNITGTSRYTIIILKCIRILLKHQNYHAIILTVKIVDDIKSNFGCFLYDL